MPGRIDATGYRSLEPDQRRLVDEWLDRCGITLAVRIRQGLMGRTYVWVTDDARREVVRLVVSDPPFPWVAVRQQPRVTDST